MRGRNTMTTTVTSDQFAELLRQVGTGQITHQHLQVLLAPHDSAVISFIDWRRLYEVLDMSYEYAKFIEVHSSGLTAKSGFQTMPVLKGLTYDRVVQAFRKLGVTVVLYAGYRDVGLDTAVTKNDRHPERGSYIVSFASKMHASDDLRNFSASKLIEKGIKGLTLIEGLILELGYLITTGNRLSSDNFTLCSGSQGSHGDVLCVFWSETHTGNDQHTLYINNYGLNSVGEDLWTREVTVV